MNVQKTIFTVLLLLISCFTFAQSKRANQIADVSVDRAEILLQPTDEFAVLTLKLRGPEGIVFERQYDGADMPRIDLFDDAGVPLPDGSYAYQLVASPFGHNGSDGRDGRDVAVATSKRAFDPTTMVVSGHFRIYEGLIINPTEVELDRRVAVATKDDPPVLSGNGGNGSENGGSGGTGNGGSGNDGNENDTGGNGGSSGTSVDDTDLGNRDQVFLDDLIVTGSICVGLDCVNGESFGFDTIRLKENNLRIRFQDTSVSASFPTNDWEIQANETGNGGLNKFSIADIDGGRTPFTIEASAPSHSLYVDNGGRIGVGTDQPVVEVHVVNGDSPTVRLEQNGSSGFTPQTWDMAGNETNWFVRDATNGSPLPLRIRPSAPQNSIFVDTDGDVGLLTASPSAQLDIIGNVEVNHTTDPATSAISVLTDGSTVSTGGIVRIEDRSASAANRYLLSLVNKGNCRIALQNSNSNGSTWDFAVGTSQFYLFKQGDAGGHAMDVYEGGDVTIAGMLTQNSDKNHKENFENIDPMDVLHKVVDLPITTWNYIDNDDEIRHMGPMAQDFYAAFGLNGNDKGIGSMDTTGVAFGAIQGLNRLVEEKDAEIESLKAKLAEQDARLRAIENALLNR